MDDPLLERLRVKVKNLEEGTDDPVPEIFEFNNILHGEVVKRYMDDMANAHRFDVSFKLNGIPVEASVQLSWAEVEASGNRKAALMALAKVLSTKLALVLVEKIVKTENAAQRRLPDPEAMHGACDGFGGSDYE